MGKKIITKIGVTGSAGSGKSVVCGRLEELGLTVISSDKIAREVVLPGQSAYLDVVKLFGRSIVLPDGLLDRAALRRVISSDRDMGKQLESIVQPAIIAELSRRVSMGTCENPIVVEVPLLFELDMASMFDVTVVVAADENMLVQRVADRDNVSLEDAAGLLFLQMPQSIKVDLADYVIWNKKGMAELVVVVDQFLFENIDIQCLTCLKY